MKEVKELSSHPVGQGMRSCASGVARTKNLNKRTKKASIRTNSWKRFPAEQRRTHPDRDVE
jgi:hypothetical protein